MLPVCQLSSDLLGPAEARSSACASACAGVVPPALLACVMESLLPAALPGRGVLAAQRLLFEAAGAAARLRVGCD